jgi:hypothetical protein
MTRSVRFLSMGLLAAFVAGGCSREEGIERYTAPKPWPIKVVVDPEAKPARQGPMAAAPQVVGDRIFGAIVINGAQGWFFKAAGPKEAFVPHAEKLLSFISSLRFETDGTPAWKLPEGWSEEPESPPRFRTLILSGSPPLEMSVSVLPKNVDEQQYVLDNVNRWRMQLKLHPTDAAGVERGSLRVPTADGKTAVVVTLDAAEKAPPMVLKKFDTPAGWTDRGPSGPRKADLTAVDGDKSVEIAVTSFPASNSEMSNPVSNINRWRDQIGLPQAQPGELAKSVKEIKVNGFDGLLIQLFAPDEASATKAILVAMFIAGDEVWFVKLSGDGALAKRERDNLNKFLDSIRLEPQGATDGK